jgi:MFS family permease
MIGSLFLRAASSSMGENIQFYFNAINAAYFSAGHPLRVIIGAANVYPVSYTLGGIIIAIFFVSELLGALLLGAWSDRFGRKPFIILGPLLGAIAVLITSMTTVIWLLAFTRLLEGLSTASNAPATLDILPKQPRIHRNFARGSLAFMKLPRSEGLRLASHWADGYGKHLEQRRSWVASD